MLRLNSEGTLKIGQTRINKLPPINTKPSLLKDLNPIDDLIKNNKRNKKNIMGKPNFSRTVLNENNSIKVDESLDFVKEQKEKIILEIKGLEKRRLDLLDNVTRLEIKKGNLSKEVNEMKLSLKKLEIQKNNLNRENEDVTKNKKELCEEKNNLIKEIMDMKSNYDIYRKKIQDLDECMKNNLEKINIRKEQLVLKENYLNKMYIKVTNELKDKEKLINSEQKINIRKKLELEDIKKNLVKEKHEFNLKSMELEQGFADLNKKAEQLNAENENIKLEKNKIIEEKENIHKEKYKINKKEKNLCKLSEDINEKYKIMKKEEKKIMHERNQLEKDKKEFNDESNNVIINNMLNDIFNNTNKVMTENEVISDVSFIGSYIKDSIKKEKKLNPNDFIEPKIEIKINIDILPLYLLSNWLEENGCQVAIEKIPKDIRINNFCLHQIFSNHATEKKFTLVYNDNYNDYFLNEKNRNNIINSLKIDMSNYLQIPINEIFIINPRGPPFTIDLYIQNLDSFTKKRIEQYIRSKRKEIIILKESILLEGCKLSPDILAPEFDMKPKDWPLGNSFRGKLPYYPPYSYMGFGLKVLNTYDNGDNTWIGQCNIDGEFAVAYHGIRSDVGVVKQILNSHLKAGQNQAFEGDIDLIRPWNICGRGVYVTPYIEIAEDYTKEIYAEELNQSFRIVFQCRVDPKRIRQPLHKPDYWILNGNGQEIRPYRLLVKQENY